MKKLNGLFTIVFSLILLSCATVPMTTESLDAEGKQFALKPAKANIYIVRTGTYGSSSMFRIVLDGKIIGTVGPNTYLLLAIDPGEHSIASHSNENSEMVTFSAEARNNYFFDVNAAMGWNSNRTSIKQVTEDEGRKEVMKSKRTAAMVY